MIDLSYIGHAGWLVRADNFKAIFDPWFNPSGTFMNSWHQFPDNYHLLDDSIFSNLDFLYISHAHNDHCDEWTLQKIEKTTIVLIPNFKDKMLRNKLKNIGFTNIKEIDEGEVLNFKGIKVELIIEDGFNDRDSAIILDDGKNKILNLNDCHPSFEKIKKYSKNVNLLLMQCSSAIWWPCVYDYPIEKLIDNCKQKRKNVLNRALEYCRCISPKYVVPNAGPPVFLHDKFKFWDETRDLDFNPFPLHDDIDIFFQNNDVPSMFVIPGSLIKFDKNKIINNTNIQEKERIYGDIRKYLKDLTERKRKNGHLKSSFVPPQDLSNMTEKFSSLIKNIKKRSKIFIHKINFPVLIEFKKHSSWIIDFQKHIDFCFQEYVNQEYKYSFTFDPDIVNHLINQKEIDFDEYFLSMRFSCARKEDIFNEFLFTMFKNFDIRRFKISENIYISENMIEKDNMQTFVVETLGKKKIIQKYCPHQFVDLEKCGIVEGNTITCPLHNWKFDLDTGNCLTSDNYCLSVDEV
jgi:UDP-MurNAc hydroxylase